MNTRPFVLSIVCITLAVVTTRAADAPKDAEKIQGNWGAVSYVEDGQGAGEKVSADESPVRWDIKGDKLTMLADVEGASAKGSFKLDPAKKPKTIDITFPPAPGSKKDQVMLGIYELDGDTLTICYALDGGRRPKEFKSTAGSKNILIVFKPRKK